MSKKIFIDTNILFDIFQERQPFYKSSRQLIFQTLTDNYQLFISPLTVHIVFYVIHPKKEQRQKIIKFLKLLTIIELNRSIIQKAFQLDFPDFEDQLQYLSALAYQAPLITRNKKDFVKLNKLYKQNLPIYTPNEFNKILLH